jgi:hypothetical protein
MRAKLLGGVAMSLTLGASALAAAPAAAAPAPASAVAHPDFSQATGSEAPPVVKPGGKVNFGLDCASKSDNALAAGATMGLPSDIAMHKNGAELFGLTVTLPRTIEPGDYHVSLQCADGSFATVKFTVAPSGQVTATSKPGA